MHPVIPGYRLTQELHRSPRTLVFRAVREADGRVVVVKTIPKDYPEPQDLARLRREHRLLEGLTMPGAVRTLGLVAWENNVALVLEDGGATTLEAALQPGTGMPLDAFFRVAIALTRRGPAIAPTYVNVASGRYPLARTIDLLVAPTGRRPLNPALCDFARFVLSREGQQVVLDQGIFLPLRHDQVARSRALIAPNCP